MIVYGVDMGLVAAAVIPAVILLVYVYKKDRLEKEPLGLLVSLVVFGIIATAFALITENIGSGILSFFFAEDTKAYNFFMYFFVVALSEEGFKYLLLKKRTWRDSRFNCQFDGVVYAVFVALGFALWENIGYVLMYGFETAVARALTAVPGHACFGVFMGVWYGAAKRYEAAGFPQKSKTCRRYALGLPVLVHGLYDYIISNPNTSILLFFAFILAMFIIALRLVNKAANKDKYIN